MNWETVLLAGFSLYAELATGGAKDEADKIATILGALITATTTPKPAA